jgi:hypothetical protein
MALALVVTACSSSNPSSSSTVSSTPASSSPSSELCAQQAAAKESFNALTGTDVVAEGTNTLTTRFDAFTVDLESLRSAAHSQFSSELDAVQSSVDQLRKVVDNADNVDVATTATQSVAALGSLKTSVQALFAAVDQACQG